MKRKIIAIITAILMLAIPQAALCADGAALSPNIIVESYSVSKNDVSAGDSFKLDFKLKNTSKAIDVENVLIHISGGEAFALNNSTDTLYKDAIAKNSAASFSKPFYCAESTPAGVYPISASITYEYYDGGEKISASASSEMTVTVVKAENTALSLTPQLLISGFSYGGASVEGGANFNLKFTVKNNSNDIDVKNVLITVNGGEAFVVADGTDTVALNQISRGGTAAVEKTFKCLNNVPTGIYQATAQITYEYFENGQKLAGSANLTMSIPVVQVDKVRFESLDLADGAVVAKQENDCSFKIINSGQTRLLNGRALLLDEAGNEIVSAYIGNVEPGAMFESNYTLPFKFEEPGVKRLKLVFEYENENSEKKSIEQEITVTSEEEHDPYASIKEEEKVTYEDNGTGSKIIIACICIGLALIIIIPVTVKIVKKKKARKGSEASDEEI